MNFAVTKNGDILVRTDLFDIPVDDYIAEFRVKFDRIAGAVGLLTGNERTARTAERIEGESVRHGGIHNRIAKKRYRLHRGMFAVLLALLEFPYRGLLAVGIPLMLAILFHPKRQGSCCH